MPVKLLASNVWHRIRRQSYYCCWYAETWWISGQSERQRASTSSPAVPDLPLALISHLWRGNCNNTIPLSCVARGNFISTPEMRFKSFELCRKLVCKCSECRMTLVPKSVHLSPGNLCSPSLTFPQLLIYPSGSASLGYLSRSLYSLVSQLLKNESKILRVKLFFSHNFSSLFASFRFPS